MNNNNLKNFFVKKKIRELWKPFLRPFDYADLIKWSHRFFLRFWDKGMGPRAD